MDASSFIICSDASREHLLTGVTSAEPGEQAEVNETVKEEPPRSACQRDSG
jgi:hypothetical protein